MMIQFDISRRKSVLALAGAMEKEQLIFLVAQSDLEDGEPKKEQLYQMGVVAKDVYKRQELESRRFSGGYGGDCGGRFLGHAAGGRRA